jgi:hypothetical protein
MPKNNNNNNKKNQRNSYSDIYLGIRGGPVMLRTYAMGTMGIFQGNRVKKLFKSK